MNRGGRPKGSLGPGYQKPKPLNGVKERFLRADFRRRWSNKKSELIKQLNTRQKGICPRCKTLLKDMSHYGRPVIRHTRSFRDFAKELTVTNCARLTMICNGPENLSLVHHGCNIALKIEEHGGWEKVHPHGNS